MKRFIPWFFLALLLCPLPCRALEAELESTLEGVLASYDLGAWQESYSQLPQEIRELWGYGDVRSLIAGYALGEEQADGGLLTGLWRQGLAAVAASMKSLGAILAITLICGLLEAILGRGQNGVKEMANFLCYGVCVMILSAMMAGQLSLAAQAVGDICGLLEALAPLLVALLAAVGATSSAGMVQPVFVLLSGTVAKAVQEGLLPAVMSAGVLQIVGALTGQERIGRLSAAIKSFVKWAMGGLTTIFLGIMTIRGMSAGGVDSLSFRTMKYTLDKSLPLVGGVVAGSLDSVRGCTILIKNAAGIAAVLLGLGMVLTPLLQLGGMSLALRLTGALCAQVSDGRMPRMLDGLADICRYMFGCVGLVTLMYVLTMGLVAALGSGV